MLLKHLVQQRLSNICAQGIANSSRVSIDAHTVCTFRLPCVESVVDVGREHTCEITHISDLPSEYARQCFRS